ncbi:MAG: PilZ domain-containing protein [Myxococcales bacterium]|nr:PilZ domain-containing protein [Myxococcales bacterium]
MPTQESRREVRVPTRIFVNVTQNDQSQYLSRAVDLSSNGVQLSRLPEERPESRFAWLLFWLPTSSELIRALGERVHERDGEHLSFVGYRFKYLSPKHRVLLQQYLDVQTQRVRKAA